MNQWLLIRRLRGPAFILLVGIMALLDQWHIIGFGRSWPLLLILAGLLALAERAALSQADLQNYAQQPGVHAAQPGSTTYGPPTAASQAAPNGAPAAPTGTIPGEGGQ